MSQSPSRKRKSTFLHSTPTRSKKVHSSQPYQSGRLEEARVAVLDDLGPSIPVISFKAFLDHLAPQGPPFDFGRTMKSLGEKRSGNSEPVLTSSNQSRWSQFPTDPKHLRSEKSAFSPLPEIFKEVVDAIVANSCGKLKKESPTVDFLQNPDLAPTSAERHNESRPDGYLVLKNRKKDKVHWADVVLSCEYKLRDGQDDIEDDVEKIIWSLQHVMRDDARRRASFGMTIENTTTRLWFCCRSMVIVTEPFNFIENPEYLVRLFAAFAFADEKSLGFDTTVQPVTGQDGKFIITVHPHNDKQVTRRFQTIDIISSSGADPLRGRGTRVFKAVELDGNGLPIGPNVVLKDIWIDDDRTREGNILAAMHEAAKGGDKQLFETHFLTTICHGDVLTERDIVDDTANALMRGLKISQDHKLLYDLQQHRVIRNVKPASRQGLKGACLTRVPHSHIRYADKTHYRIVFKEVCTTIDCLTSFACVMTILAETVSALWLLRKLGWVHRDVSIGNILSLDGHAKLADLEYAKETKDPSCHEMRTASESPITLTGQSLIASRQGTMHFMSIEVAAQRFLFSSKRRRRTRREYSNMLVQEKKPTLPDKVPFFHNHLHDLESLWWVAVWIVFHNHFLKTRDHPPTLQDTTDHLRGAESLFPSTFGSSSRTYCFEQPEEFCHTFHKFTEEKQNICLGLEGLRESLISDYNIIETGYPTVEPKLSTDDIYNEFIETFTLLKNHFDDFSLEFIPAKHIELVSMNNAGVAQKAQTM